MWDTLKTHIETRPSSYEYTQCIHIQKHICASHTNMRRDFQTSEVQSYSQNQKWLLYIFILLGPRGG